MNTWDIPDEVHAAVSALLEKNTKLKALLVDSQVEGQRFAIWLLGHRQDKISLDDLPCMDDLPEDVQAAIIEKRKVKYGIE